MPLIELGAWNDCGEGNPRMHVFSLVINQKLVGYCPIGWHLVIEDYNGRRLDASGKPVESDDQLVVIVGQDFLARDFSNEPRLLKGWAVKGICILSEYQRRGLGKLLLRSALDYLGTNEKEVAYTPPLTPAGEALIKSLGLNMEDIRLSPSI
jgi:GNAT superfamily N-acetyltransferase